MDWIYKYIQELSGALKQPIPITKYLFADLDKESWKDKRDWCHGMPLATSRIMQVGKCAVLRIQRCSFKSTGDLHSLTIEGRGIPAQSLGNAGSCCASELPLLGIWVIPAPGVGIPTQGTLRCLGHLFSPPAPPLWCYWGWNECHQILLVLELKPFITSFQLDARPELLKETQAKVLPSAFVLSLC